MTCKLVCGLLLSAAVVSARAETVLETLLVIGPDTNEARNLAPNIVRIDAPHQLPGVRIDSAELLRGLPGVQADSRSNYAQDTRVTLRGFGARSAFGVRGIDLQVDGVPLTTPDGQGQLSSVALDSVQSVEVLRGPIAALYGNGAGGVIALQSAAPTHNEAGVRLLGGENGMSRSALHGQWHEENLGAKVHISHFTTDGDRPHSSAERQHAGAQFYYTHPNGIEAVIRVDSSRDPLLEDPLGLTPAQWRDDPQQANAAAELFNTRKSVSHRQVSLTLRQAEGEGRWQTSLWRGAREITQYLAFAGDAPTSAGGVVDLERDFYGVNGNYSRDFSLGSTLLTATLGAELANMDDRRRGFVNNLGEAGDLRRNELGEVESRDVYTILQWQPAERWQIFGGARRSDLTFEVADYFVMPGNPDDSGERTYDDWSSAFGVNYALTNGWTFFASLGRGFETPTLTEMAYRPESSGLNINLDAANNRQRELGFRFGSDTSASASITIFEVDSTNEIVVDQSAGGRTTYRNAAETERQGVEVAGQLMLSEAWMLRTTINYLEADYSAGAWSGNRLPGVARQNHYTQLRWQPWLDERLTLTLAAQHRSRVATGDNNEDFAPEATTADLAVSSRHEFGDWSLQGWVKAANLTDERYVGSVIVNQGNGRSFEPAPGRNVNAGIDLTYRW